jgi:pyrophosphate--fructose-6-phosphate 1-phosphotransferase
MKEKITLQSLRQDYQPQLLPILKEVRKIALKEDTTPNVHPEIVPLFEHTQAQKVLRFEKGKKLDLKPISVGIVFSGGQASGGHNVVCGLFDALKSLDPKNTLIGFLNGPSGLIEQHYSALDEKTINVFRNQGGFNMIGSGRTKIETKEQFAKALETVKKLHLDGLVIVGGDDSNTNACVLAEYFKKEGQKTQVIGVPKTIDGDLKSFFIETSFGFDSACKTYCELIGNITQDCLSAKKYYHFIKLMGRSASHIALECALQTQPNYTFISEEVQKQNKSLDQLVEELVEMIEARAKMGKEYGIVLIPEGIIEFIEEFKVLIGELNSLLAKSDPKEAVGKLTQASQKVYMNLPQMIQDQLLLDRDPHGNVQVSHIESEKLFIELCRKQLKERGFKGKFSPLNHFFGYEGRACFPSNFDCDYCYCLGYMATVLILQEKTGYICAIKNLDKSPSQWQPFAVPIVSMLHLEMRKGVQKPVIEKALVDLDGKVFKAFVALREGLKTQDQYLNPGPIQFFGNEALQYSTTKTLDYTNSH